MFRILNCLSSEGPTIGTTVTGIASTAFVSSERESSIMGNDFLVMKLWYAAWKEGTANRDRLGRAPVKDLFCRVVPQSFSYLCCTGSPIVSPLHRNYNQAPTWIPRRTSHVEYLTTTYKTQLGGMVPAVHASTIQTDNRPRGAVMVKAGPPWSNRWWADSWCRT
jgi:hypothetical protein